MQQQQKTLYMLFLFWKSPNTPLRWTDNTLDAVERTHQDVTMLYNITSLLYTSLNYQQIVLHIHSILANLRDSLYHMRQVAMHAMDYIDTAITSCTPSTRSLENVNTHWRGITFNHALTSFLRVHTALLQIPMHPHFDCRWTVSPFNWCTHTGSCTTTRDISSLLFSHITQNLISTLQHRYQVFRHKPMMEQKQWKFQNNSSLHVNRQKDSFAVSMHLFNHLPTHHHVLQLFMPRTK